MGEDDDTPVDRPPQPGRVRRVTRPAYTAVGLPHSSDILDNDDTAGSVLAFVTQYDTPGINPRTSRPWKDAKEFQGRARALVKMHGGRVVLFDDRLPMKQRADVVLDRITEHQGSKLVCVAFFCHGWARGIEAGFDIRPRMGVSPQLLAEVLAAKSGTGLIVPLFCCSTASSKAAPEPPAGGDGGFADELRDALCVAGVTNCRVDASAKDGHTSRNPFKRRFAGTGHTVGAKGGQWIIAPSDPRFPRWRRWLAAEGKDNDLLFPFLDTPTIRTRVGT
jgi:hypothetical protein